MSTRQQRGVGSHDAGMTLDRMREQGAWLQQQVADLDASGGQYRCDALRARLARPACCELARRIGGER